MAITKEQLSEAFSPLAELKKTKDKGETTKIDIGKIAESLVDEMAVLTEEQEDPDAAVTKLEGRVDEITKMLEGASEDEAGEVTVMAKADDELIKEFVVEEKEEETTSKSDDDEEDGGEETEGDETPCDEVSAEIDEVIDPMTDEEVEKGLDDEAGWPDDMSPTKSPVRRAERLTKSERPVRGGRSGRKAVEKYENARNRAFGRKGGRCMT